MFYTWWTKHDGGLLGADSCEVQKEINGIRWGHADLGDVQKEIDDTRGYKK